MNRIGSPEVVSARRGSPSHTRAPASSWGNVPGTLIAPAIEIYATAKAVVDQARAVVDHVRGTPAIHPGAAPHE